MSSAEEVGSEPLDVTEQTQEVRLAMAWNGGVSLAVWMGGAAVEFDCARRAHLGHEDHGAPEEHGAEKPGSHPRTIYHTLCRAFDRVLVVDILTGASAGGINGALLGAVITRRRRLHPAFVRERWLDLGDFSKLLRPTNDREPESLMDGELFARAMVDSFRTCLSEQGADPDAAALGDFDVDGWLPEEVLLDVQATNVYGIQRGFQDHWGEFLYAREYRSPIRFRTREDFRAGTLAAAARASASFPGAFEPAKIDGESAALAGYPGKVRWGIDGGLLENAPIEAAIELIPQRPAIRSVRRFVCYVNADPPNPGQISDEVPSPNLRDVLGYVVNLPRDARFIDELTAIEKAARRAGSAFDSLPELARLDWQALRQTAEALLPAYRKRRALGSLEEITVAPGQPPAPGRARAIFDRLEDQGKLRLPWIPDGPLIESDIVPWRWGIRTAQRVLYLELDLLRLAREEGAAPEVLIEGRKPIDRAINDLEELGRTLHATASVREATRELGDAPNLEEKLQVLDDVFAQFRNDILAALRSGTAGFTSAISGLPLEADLLADSAGDPEAALGAFLRRALAIEVVRRAFAADYDVDSAQRLLFAQLTPLAPCPLLTPTPFHDTGPRTPEEKLTGIALGHFAGFYRGSWRANDFMWGRLDAAVRIVDLLVDPERGRGVGKRAADPVNPASVLAEALVPPAGDPTAEDRRELVREALGDADRGYDNAPQKVVELLGGGVPDDPTELRDLVADLITADLEANGSAKLTRLLCARAAQYETLRQELPVLAEHTLRDGKLGCFTEPLALNPSPRFVDAIRDLRASTETGLPLPNRLGRDSADESTSMLALRTLSHALLVALAALRSISMPLARVFAPGRVPFLSVSGLTSSSAGKRLAAGVAFGASSAYITARLLGANEGATAPLESVTSLSALVMWIAALAVVALVAVPAWRGFRSEEGLRKLGQWTWAIALAAAGGGVIVAYAYFHLGLWETLTASSGPTPPEWMLWLVLAVLGPVAILARRLPVLTNVEVPIRGAVDKLDTGGGLTAILVFAASGVILVWSAVELVRGLNDGAWDVAGALLAVAAVVLGCFYALFGRWRGRARVISAAAP